MYSKLLIYHKEVDNMHDYSGIHCPIITPFKTDGSVDEDGLRNVIEFVLKEQKCIGIVPCGTTGESPVLNNEEHLRVIQIAVEQANGRVPVMAGVGSNCTTETLHLIEESEKLGADSYLIVGPYYNKPTMEGMFAHFKAIASATNKPIFIYNIPGRTSKNIEPKTILDIAKASTNVIGLKDAAGSIDQTMEIMAGSRKLGKKFYVLAGDDQMVFLILTLGGDGGICAVSHVIGKELMELFNEYKKGNIENAREIHFSILPMIKALFSETNPSPIKAALEMIGVINSDPLRLPLVPMSTAGREKLRIELKNLGKI